LYWTGVAIATALVAASCAAIYAGLSRAIRRAVAERQQDTDRQLSALTTKINALQTRVIELTASQAESTQAADSVTGENMAGQPQPETLAIIAAAATTFLGKTARIRSANALSPAQEGAGTWAQQGRVIVQTSHNLRSGS
jgi:hypothetical protein